MIARNPSMVAVVAFLLAQCACATDLDLAIRTHPATVAVGDPIYVEVTITNRGTAAITAPGPSTSVGNFRFEVFDANASLVFRDPGGGGGFVGRSAPIKYEPGTPIKRYWFFFAPGLNQLRHPFWRLTGTSRGFLVSGVYTLKRQAAGGALELRSDSQDLIVKDRSANEITSLEHWQSLRPQPREDGPSPNDFGIGIGSVLHLQQTRQFARELKPSELTDMLNLSARLQELFATPPASRAPLDKELTDWLRSQPTIKARALATASRNTAEGNNMDSTVAALDELLGKE